MKKKVGALLLSSALMLSLCVNPVMAVEGNGNEGLAERPEPRIVSLEYLDKEGQGHAYTVKGSERSYSFEDAWAEFIKEKDTEPQEGRVGKKGFKYGVIFGIISSCEIDGTTPEDKDAFTVDREMMFRLRAVKGPSITNPDEVVNQYKFCEPFVVADGGILSIAFSGTPQTKPEEGSEIKVTLEAPITVEEGGEFNISPIAQLRNVDTIVYCTLGEDANIEIGENASFELGPCMDVTKEGDAPAFVVNAGGSLHLHDDYSPTSAFDFVDPKISGSGTLIEVKDGATLTLDCVEIETTGEAPAVNVAEGAKLEIPDASKVEVISANTGEKAAAISLGAGATVKMANTEVTVASAEETNETVNYIDNHGVMVLSAGATKGEDDAPMNAALVMGDGTIIEGSKSAAPTYTVNEEEGKITTTVPAGGKVTDSDGKTVEMPNGGSVTSTEDGSDVEVEEVPATGITLDKTSVTLYSNTTPNTVTLTATVQPSNTTDTVAWSSDNTGVATVDNNGVVTAVANGTATITAKAGDQTATCTVTVKTYSSGGGSSSDDSDPTYSISAPDKVTGGSIKVTPSRASAGIRVTITAKPSSGYELDELTVTDNKGNELKVTDRGNDKYTFQMPSGKVEIEVRFTKIEETTEPDPSTGFVDIPANAYYADAVEWAVSKGITSGTSATTFSPDTSCTRAQMVTFLWRAAGSPAPKSTVNPFTDVQAGSYYYDAVLWAVEQGITSGTSATTFAPDATVTRGQTVTFLYRAAGSPAVTGGSFADVAADAYYAAAVAWAVSENVTAGTGNGLFAPDTACSRAQIVTFLYRDAL